MTGASAERSFAMVNGNLGSIRLLHWTWTLYEAAHSRLGCIGMARSWDSQLRKGIACMA